MGTKITKHIKSGRKEGRKEETKEGREGRRRIYVFCEVDDKLCCFCPSFYQCNHHRNTGEQLRGHTNRNNEVPQSFPSSPHLPSHKRGVRVINQGVTCTDFHTRTRAGVCRFKATSPNSRFQMFSFVPFY